MKLMHLNHVPANLRFAGKTADEIRRGGWMLEGLVRSSTEVWCVEDEEPLCIAGVIRSTFLSPVHFWFLLCEGFTKDLKRNLRACRELMPELARRYHYVFTYVERGDTQAEKFAKFFGWQRTDDTFELAGRQYDLYRVVE